MTTSFYMISLIAGCALVTWLPRILPFTIVKNIKIPNIFMRWLHYIPVCILYALIVDSCIDSETTLRLHWQNLFAFIPTVIMAIWTKSLSFTVIVGVLTMALLRFMF